MDDDIQKGADARPNEKDEDVKQGDKDLIPEHASASLPVPGAGDKSAVAAVQGRRTMAGSGYSKLRPSKLRMSVRCSSRNST